MDIHLTGRRIKITPAIRQYVQEKVDKAEKYFDHIVRAQVVLVIEKRAHKAEIVIHAARQTFRAIATASDLYSAVDLASDKMDAQLKKHKDRLRDHHKTPSAPLKAEAAAPEGGLSFSLVRRAVAPMSPEEAVGAMESLGHSFMMYQDNDTGLIQVVYRRTDESYGILQPVKKGGGSRP